MFRSAYVNTSNRDNIPDDNVLYYFVNADLKMQFLTSSCKLSFLNVYLIWKVITYFFLELFIHLYI